MARNPGRKSKVEEVEEEVEDQEEEGSGEEYEIEEIVQYKVDAFKDVRVRYSISLCAVAFLMMWSHTASGSGLQGQVEGLW